MSLWLDTVVGIAVSHIEALECSSVVHHDPSFARSIQAAIERSVRLQPRYFRFGIKIAALCFGLLCMCIMRQRPTALSSADRERFMRRIQSIPFFGLLDTFAQGIAFLKFFDHPMIAALMPTTTL